MRKVLPVLLVFVFAALPLFGEGQAEEVDPDRPTVRLSHAWTGEEKELFEPVLEAAEAELNITVADSVLRHEDLVQLLPTQWQAEMAPADVMSMRPGLAQQGVEEGHLLPVTDIIDPDDFAEGAGEVTVHEGELYNVPYISKPKPGFWYRESFFEEHGLSEPDTWEEFVELLEEIDQIPGVQAPIASGNGDGWPLTDVVEHFLIAFGSGELHQELTRGEKSWLSDEVVSIFDNRIVPLLEEGYFSDPVEWTTALERWWDGDFGIYFMGGWLTGMVEDPDDLGLFVLPGTDAVVSHVDSWYVSAYADEPEAAMEFVEWLATEGQRIHVEQGGAIPTYLDVPYDVMPEAEQQMAEAVAHLTPVVDLDDEIGGEFQSVFWDQLQLLWVQPGQLDQVLEAIHEVSPYVQD